jgi:hypothetical protein
MSDEMVYRRTTAGQAAVREHSAVLDVRERTLLVQIDGKRRLGDIRIRMAVLMDVDATLASLLRRSMIEVDPALSPVVAAPPASANGAAGAMPVVELSTLRRALIRAVHDSLGPEGEQIELRLEGEKTLEALREVAERASGLIESVRGHAAAEAFRAVYR